MADKVKSKGVVFADPHIQIGNVSSRRDDFLPAILQKMQEVFDIAEEEKADYVLCLGDLFEKADPSGRCRNPLLEFLLKRKLPFQFYSVVGNHDVFGHTIHTLPNTGLYTLMHAGAVKIENEVPEFGIFCGHYEHNIESVQLSSEMPIWAVHANILPFTFFEGAYILTKNYPTTAKLVLSGHYHPGYDTTVRDDGVIFVNPGSLGRISIKDAKHDIRIALVELDGDEVNVQYRPVTSAQPAHLVFGDLASVPSYAATQPIKVDAENLMAILQAAKISTSSGADSLDLIQKIAEKMDPPPTAEVMAEAQKRILKVRQIAQSD